MTSKTIPAEMQDFFEQSGVMLAEAYRTKWRDRACFVMDNVVEHLHNVTRDQYGFCRAAYVKGYQEGR